MGGLIKGIAGPIIAKRAAKKAHKARQAGIQGAIDEQDAILKDITASQEGLRDENIEDIEGLALRSSQEYDDYFGTASELLQRQFDDVSALQQGAFDSNEARLLANLDDALTRSQQSFDYAQKNLMPFISQGQEAFNQYAQKVQEGFDYQTFDEEFQAPDQFQYDDFQFDYEQSPGYQFAKQQALDAATNTAAAQGMGLSGATQKALADRAAGLAAQDYGNQFNRALTQYQMDRDRDYREYADEYARDRQEFAQRYDIDRANQAGAYQDYLNSINALGGLGNVGLAGQQAMVNREAGLADFEIQARNSLNQALSNNDFARAEAEANNILRLTGGQGQLAAQAANIKSLIDQGKTQNIINQRSSAQGNIDATRKATGSNISNLMNEKGIVESDYRKDLGALQQQLFGGVVDGVIGLGTAAVGGMGGLGGAGGMAGAMQGLNLGSQLSNFGAGSQMSPSMFSGQSSYGARPAPQVVQAMPMQGGGGISISPMNFGMNNYPSMMGSSAGTGSSWLGGF